MLMPLYKQQIYLVPSKSYRPQIIKYSVEFEVLTAVNMPSQFYDACGNLTATANILSRQGKCSFHLYPG
jgi:hypothetical protein